MGRTPTSLAKPFIKATAALRRKLRSLLAVTHGAFGLAVGPRFGAGTTSAFGFGAGFALAAAFTLGAMLEPHCNEHTGKLQINEATCNTRTHMRGIEEAPGRNISFLECLRVPTGMSRVHARPQEIPRNDANYLCRRYMCHLLSRNLFGYRQTDFRNIESETINAKEIAKAQRRTQRHLRPAWGWGGAHVPNCHGTCENIVAGTEHKYSRSIYLETMDANEMTKHDIELGDT